MKITITGEKTNGKKKTDRSKKNLIAMLFQENDVHTATNLENALKDFMGTIIESMLEAEMNYK